VTCPPVAAGNPALSAHTTSPTTMRMKTPSTSLNRRGNSPRSYVPVSAVIAICGTGAAVGRAVTFSLSANMLKMREVPTDRTPLQRSAPFALGDILFTLFSTYRLRLIDHHQEFIVRCGQDRAVVSAARDVTAEATGARSQCELCCWQRYRCCGRASVHVFAEQRHAVPPPPPHERR